MVNVTWAYGILKGAIASDFPVRTIPVAHARMEFYFLVNHQQVTKNPQQWYYHTNIRWPPGVYMVNRQSSPRGIHVALPGVAYGGDAAMPVTVPSLWHERCHNVSSAHSNDNRDLMRPTVFPWGLPTQNDYNRYLRSWQFRPGRPKPWDPGEKERWQLNPSMVSALESILDPDWRCASEEEAEQQVMLALDWEKDIQYQWIDEDPGELQALMREMFPNMDQ